MYTYTHTHKHCIVINPQNERAINKCIALICAARISKCNRINMEVYGVYSNISRLKAYMGMLTYTRYVYASNRTEARVTSYFIRCAPYFIALRWQHTTHKHTLLHIHIFLLLLLKCGYLIRTRVLQRTRDWSTVYSIRYEGIHIYEQPHTNTHTDPV